MSLHHGLRSAAGASVADPYFASTSLLLLGNGTNGGQNNTFVDGSSNAFSVTRYGNTTQGTFSPFGYNWGVYTSDGNFPTCSYTAFNSVSSDFTVECWAYVEDAGRSGDSNKYGGLVAGGNTGTDTNGWAFYLQITSGVISLLGLGVGGSAVASVSSLSISLNAWHHFAMVRSGSTVTFYVDGTSVGSGTYSSTINSNSSGRTTIGQGNYGSPYQNYVKGYFSNVRIVVGTAVYTANFTPATTNLTAITNTTLLTCQDNRFKDNSSNAFAISVTGSPSVTNFAPFATGTEYSTGTNGGSGYFDGSGDYLTIPNSTAYRPGASTDFTIEGWLWVDAFPASYYRIITSGTSGSATTNFGVSIDSAGKISLYTESDGTLRTSSNATTAGQWNHFAISRSGTGSNNLRIYVNGTSTAFTTNVALDNSKTAVLAIGSDSAGTDANFKGYLSNIRIVVGSAVYSGSSLTVPSTNLTAITNTSLLLNFTNASVIDSTGKNDIETVGDAQISTSTKKYGTGSLKFDGTGDYLILQKPSSLLTDWHSSNFTVEFWLYANAFSEASFTPNPNASPVIGNMDPTSFINYWSFGPISNGTVRLYYYNNGWAGIAVTTTTALNTSQWYHLAMVNDGGTAKIFIDGVSSASAAFNGTPQSSTGTAFVIGRVAGTAFNGYIDDLRITKGVARYTAAFTPPSRQLPAR